MKANWSCTVCGMYSSRRYSVQRHINNRHNGKGHAIPFVEYIVGRRSGLYQPGPHPTYVPNGKPLLEKITEEAERVYISRVAQSAFPPVGHPSYKGETGVLALHMLKRNNEELSRSNRSNLYLGKYWKSPLANWIFI